MQFLKPYKIYRLHLLILTMFLGFLSLVLTAGAQEIEVTGESRSPFTYPWAGGMNSMQFGELDMNLDGIKDLVAFDREGDRKICFINNGTPNTIDYSFRPEYAENIPELYKWAIFADYNMDGKNDIFTYSPGYASMMVYKNISDQVLKFERVVYPYLTSYQGSGYVNIYVTYADYPGITDVDNDGDLDILTFWGLGSFVEMHQNMSMEKYGIPDSLDYEQVTFCWGHFAESDESNVIYLDTCLMKSHQEEIPGRDLRHTGSTFLMLDLDADNNKDLLLGDVDYPNIFALYNGGTIDEAYITSFDTVFPSVEENVQLFSMPAAAYIDVNNDEKKDLLVSPFDPNPFISNGKESVWLYLNEGENNQPVFELHTKDFLQADMIDRGSGAYPVLFDWDHDGLDDLFVGNYGEYQYSYYENYFLRSVFRSRLAYYKNTGTTGNPQFELYDNNFAGLWSKNLLGIFPAFADLNGDGTTDLLVGNEKGTLIFMRNDGGNFSVSEEQYFNIDVGEYSTPQLFDLDKDGLKDLLIGEKGGNINYYRNTGTSSQPEFSFITDSLGKINVTDPMISYNGYSTPWFFEDAQNNTRLVVGSEQGFLFCFDGIDGNLDGLFTPANDLHELLDTTDVSFDRGYRTSATLAHISGGGYLKMIAGNFSGGLEYFNGSAEVLPGIIQYVSNNGNVNIYPNPADDFVHISVSIGRIRTISVYSLTGQLVYQQHFDRLKSTEINVNNLNKGMYLARIETDAGNYVVKISIE